MQIYPGEEGLNPVQFLPFSSQNSSPAISQASLECVGIVWVPLEWEANRYQVSAFIDVGKARAANKGIKNLFTKKGTTCPLF